MDTTHPHSRGPWKVDASGLIYSAEGRARARVMDADFPHGKANAALIAAAPELLTTLKRIIREIDYEGEISNLHEIRAAIAKAEGR